MFYHDSTRPIKEQLKNVHISIPRTIILLMTEIILMTSATFLGIIGAYTICSFLMLGMFLLYIFFPIAMHKNIKAEPIVWTIHKNKPTE